MRYVCSVIRFVPEPARGEFVNIGVLAGREDGSEWHLRHVKNFNRALSAGSKLAFQTARADLDRIDACVAGEDLLGVDWLTELAGASRSVLQLSEPVPVSAESAQAASDLIFGIKVLDPERRERASAGAAKNALRAAYGRRIPLASQNVHSKVKAVVDGQSAQFDFAIANGHLVQLSKAWSFDVKAVNAATTQVRAWGYAVGLIRDQRHAASLSAGPGLQYDVPNSIDIAAVYVPPSTARGEDALGRSIEVFKTLDVSAVPIAKAGDIAKRAAEALAA